MTLGKALLMASAEDNGAPRAVQPRADDQAHRAFPEDAGAWKARAERWRHHVAAAPHYRPEVQTDRVQVARLGPGTGERRPPYAARGLPPCWPTDRSAPSLLAGATSDASGRYRERRAAAGSNPRFRSWRDTADLLNSWA